LLFHRSSTRRNSAGNENRAAARAGMVFDHNLATSGGVLLIDGRFGDIDSTTAHGGLSLTVMNSLSWVRARRPAARSHSARSALTPPGHVGCARRKTPRPGVAGSSGTKPPLPCMSPWPSWLKHRRCLVFSPPSWPKHRLCLVLPLPSWLGHRLCFVCFHCLRG
jgi:hypothetical protein